MNAPLTVLDGDVTEEPRTRTMVITPAQAQKLLDETNHHNRPMKWRNVHRFARDMREGRWQLNGQALIWGTTGQLLDGQNRLAAVVEADTAIRFSTVTGIDPVAQATIDLGAKRSTGDVLSMDQAGTKDLAALARLAWMWDRGHRTFSTDNPTTPELIEYIGEHPELEASLAVGARLRKRRLPASILGLSHLLCTRIDATDADEFFRRYHDGANLTSTSPILALRNRVTAELGKQGTLPQATWLALFLRAWNAYRTDKPLVILRYKPERDSFPEPI